MSYRLFGLICLALGIWLALVWLRPNLLGGRMLRLAVQIRIWRRRDPGNPTDNVWALVNVLAFFALGAWSIYRGG